MRKAVLAKVRRPRASSVFATLIFAGTGAIALLIATARTGPPDRPTPSPLVGVPATATDRSVSPAPVSSATAAPALPPSTIARPSSASAATPAAIASVTVAPSVATTPAATTPPVPVAAAGSPTPAARASPPPSPSPSPSPTGAPSAVFPAGVDPARTGASGRLIGVIPGYVRSQPLPPGTPLLAGLPVRILDLVMDPAASVRYYGGAVTGPDGRWTITGIPPGSQYFLDIQCSWPAAQVIGGPPCVPTDTSWHPESVGLFSESQTSVVANRIVDTGDVALTRMVTITSPGATVTSGPLTLSWSAVTGATTYCVIIGDQTANAVVAPSGPTCGPASLSWSATSATTLKTAPLISGHTYAFSVLALDRTPDAQFSGLCSGYNVVSGAWTCVAQVDRTVSVR